MESRGSVNSFRKNPHGSFVALCNFSFSERRFSGHFPPCSVSFCFPPSGLTYRILPFLSPHCTLHTGRAVLLIFSKVLILPSHRQGYGENPRPFAYMRAAADWAHIKMEKIQKCLHRSGKMRSQLNTVQVLMLPANSRVHGIWGSQGNISCSQ